MNVAKKIVLVEDDDILSEIICSTLIEYGFDVICAMDGEEALIKIQDQTPDLVLLDMFLPKKRGTEVLAALKMDPKTRQIPVIMLSVLGSEEDRKRCKEIGANGYIMKSQYGIESLGKKVSDFFTAS
jgi:two-component system phosphate regulon response regulator PhoB